MFLTYVTSLGDGQGCAATPAKGRDPYPGGTNPPGAPSPAPGRDRGHPCPHSLAGPGTTTRPTFDGPVSAERSRGPQCTHFYCVVIPTARLFELASSRHSLQNFPLVFVSRAVFTPPHSVALRANRINSCDFVLSSTKTGLSTSDGARVLSAVVLRTPCRRHCDPIPLILSFDFFIVSSRYKHSSVHNLAIGTSCILHTIMMPPILNVLNFRLRDRSSRFVDKSCWQIDLEGGRPGDAGVRRDTSRHGSGGANTTMTRARSPRVRQPTGCTCGVCECPPLRLTRNASRTRATDVELQLRPLATTTVANVVQQHRIGQKWKARA
ncbi:hypothetical protein ALC53_05649 [Atta colombica]|uniref:Uncharacterized protein n=1 Tax=Atta colombica TaxID=520822 RepID=A0A151I3Q4_9HYME|nr:hypothetical protein ALC53_05649 [Atta colombica]